MDDEGPRMIKDHGLLRSRNNGRTWVMEMLGDGGDGLWSFMGDEDT